MRVPNLTNADSILNQNIKVEINGKWYVAKPMGFYGICLKRRLYLAWNVFIGKYDVLIYQQDHQPKDTK